MLKNVKSFLSVRSCTTRGGCPATEHREEVTLDWQKISHLYQDSHLPACDTWHERITAQKKALRGFLG